MTWEQGVGHDKHHEIWRLLNDKRELLARIEGFGTNPGIWYPWIIDVERVDVLRRVGPMDMPLENVKSYCERVMAGGISQNHKTAGESRADAYCGDDVE